MKKVIYKLTGSPLLLLLALCLLMAASCKKDNSQPPPSITKVRNYAAAPGDSLVSSIGPGQWIVVIGSNLRGAVQVFFDGVPASFNEALFSDTSAVILLPAVISFPTITPDKLNTIRYVTSHGETTFKFPIVPPAPVITSVSNENANPGDSITIYGLNFFFIQTVSFAGTPITVYNGAVNGTSIGMKVPAGLTAGGPITITTKSGVATTPWNVNDVQTSVFCNFDNINVYSWGATGVFNDATVFPGNRARYVRMSFPLCPAFDWAWYNGGRGCQMNAGQWIPATKVTDSVTNYALKFEIFAKSPWASGTIFIHDGGWGRTCRFEPWKTAVGGVFQTTGWTTMTVPMTEFRTKVNGVDGTGPSALIMSELTGTSGNKAMQFNFANPSVAVVNFDVAIDNIRIVKIR